MSNLSLKHLLLAATVAIAGTFSCRQAEELSSEAEIVSFTFDTSVDANSIVTSQPVINGDSITFSVSSDSVSEQLSALVPTITVSENATVSPASGSAVDFSQGSVTFTVTAQDGVTTRAYFAKAVTDTTDNPDITYPIDEQLAGEYKGLLNITLGGEPVGSDIAKNITVAKVDDETVSLTLEDFSFMGMELGTIKVDSCRIVGSDIPEYDYTLSGEQTLTLNVIGEQHVTVDGGFFGNTISLTISIDFNGTPVDVTFEGTKLTGNESSEALITAFTFDTSVEANSIVTSQPVINGNSISFSVGSDATVQQLSALVPTITVSENATVSPASGSAVDFSQGAVTFIVTAEDGVTTTSYTATATKDQPSYPIDEQLAGEYKGLLDIMLGGGPVGSDIPKNITVAKVDDENVSLTLEDFSFMGIELGTIKVDKCKISGSDVPEYEYSLSGEQTLTLNVIGEQHVTVSGGFAGNTISLTISLDFNGTPVDVTFDGTKLTGSESSEALITSFTFDASNSANAAVFGTTLDQDNRTISVTVQDGGDLTALVPTIEVSAGATVSPASGTAIDLSNGQSVIYTVVAEDGTASEYTVSVSGRAAYFYDFETWTSEGAMYPEEITNPVGWATCNDAVALIKNMGPLLGHPEYNGEYPVRPTDDGVEGKGAIIESVYTSYGDMMGQTIPAVTSGTIFLGTFNAMAAMQDPMSTTQFGILFEDKPLAVTGWLKYTPGEDFYDENGNTIDKQDLGTVNAVLYEVSSEDETLNGSNIYTSEKIYATGSFETAGAADFTQFTVNMEYVKDYDPSKTYKLAVIFAASKEGNAYRAASGSIMVVDNVAIICE